MKIRSIVLAFVLYSCTDEAITTKPYPDVVTLPVSNITDEGALFQATISNNADLITDKGFIWESFGIQEIQHVTSENNETFSYQATSRLANSDKYTVRAFVKINELTIFGDSVSFLSKGSHAPVFTDFYPKTARCLDTLTLVGSGFSSSPLGSSVRFTGVSTRAIPVSETMLRVVVPTKLISTYQTSFDLYLTSARMYAGSGPQQFQLDPASPYELISSDKASIKMCDTLTLTARLLPPDITSIEIFFNNTFRQPYFKNGNILKVKVPFIPVNTSDITVKLVVGDIESILPAPLGFNPPEITSFSPATFSPLTILTVTGQNFPVCAMSGRVNGKQVALTNMTATQFKFEIPEDVNAPFDLSLYSTQGAPLLTYTFE